MKNIKSIILFIKENSESFIGVFVFLALTLKSNFIKKRISFSNLEILWKIYLITALILILLAIFINSKKGKKWLNE